jgi:hypothetical protein
MEIKSDGEVLELMRVGDGEVLTIMPSGNERSLPHNKFEQRLFTLLDLIRIAGRRKGYPNSD